MLCATNQDTWPSARSFAVPSALLLSRMFSLDRPQSAWLSQLIIPCSSSQVYWFGHITFSPRGVRYLRASIPILKAWTSFKHPPVGPAHFFTIFWAWLHSWSPSTAINSGAVIVFRNKVILCDLWTNGRLQTRGCITNQVHNKMVKRQLTMRPSVPRRGDSRTQRTNACAVDNRLEPHPEQAVRFIAADHVFCQL